MIIKVIFIVLICTTNLFESESAKILGFFTAGVRSNLIVHQSLMVRLAELGHDVTVVSSLQIAKKVPKNYRYINIPITNNDQIEKASELLVKVSEGSESSISSSFTHITHVFGLMIDRHEEFVAHPEVQKLKDNEQFDLVIFGWFLNDFQIGIAAHFKCPAVMILTIAPSVFSRSYVGSPSGTAYNPSNALRIKGSMNFMERTMNFVVNAAEWTISKGVDYFINEPIYKKLFPSDKYPSFDEAKLNISLVLANHHFSLGGIEPALPALVEVGGMQIKDKPSPLPEDIQKWLDGAKDGAIFFSLGSNAKSANISPERRAIILRVLSKLKQRVLWKFESDAITDLPSNIMINEWFPQSDILAHPNTKLFISHCGFSSMTEARYHGVPILAMPIYGDQYANARTIIKEEWGVKQLIAELTEQSFSENLNEMLNNSTYTETIQKISKLYRDRPESPMDRATYWVEYVLRHNGAKHMQSPGVHLNILQYHSIDVIAFLIVCLYIALKITMWFICKLFRICKSKLKFKKD